MARPLRLEFAGALYHVTSRGDRREVIYDGDRSGFLRVLGGVVDRFNWRLQKNRGQVALSPNVVA